MMTSLSTKTLSSPYVSYVSLTDVSIRADTKSKARRNARPKGGHCEDRGPFSFSYRNITQFGKALLPD